MLKKFVLRNNLRLAIQVLLSAVANAKRQLYSQETSAIGTSVAPKRPVPLKKRKLHASKQPLQPQPNFRPSLLLKHASMSKFADQHERLSEVLLWFIHREAEEADL